MLEELEFTDHVSPVTVPLIENMMPCKSSNTLWATIFHVTNGNFSAVYSRLLWKMNKNSS